MSDYDLVKHSSISHRFVHGIVDTLIMVPVLFNVALGTAYEGYGPGMNLLSITLFYEEGIFYASRK